MERNFRISESDLNKLVNRVHNEDDLNIMDNRNTEYKEDKVNIIEISFYEDMEDTENYFQDRYEEYAENENELGGYDPDDEEYIDPNKSVWEFIDRETALSIYINNTRNATEYDEMEKILETAPGPDIEKD